MTVKAFKEQVHVREYGNMLREMGPGHFTLLLKLFY